MQTELLIQTEENRIVETDAVLNVWLQMLSANAGYNEIDDVVVDTLPAIWMFKGSYPVPDSESVWCTFYRDKLNDSDVKLYWN